MRPGLLLLAMTMIASGAPAEADCPAGGNVRSQAECVHDQMSPDVIGKLYRLALSTVPTPREARACKAASKKQGPLPSPAPPASN